MTRSDGRPTGSAAATLAIRACDALPVVMRSALLVALLVSSPALAQDASASTPPAGPAATPPPPSAPAPGEPLDSDGQEEGDVIYLPPPEPLPSVMEAYDAEPAPMLGNRFGLRPVIGLVLTTEPGTQAGARLGANVVHHWWTVPKQERAITFSGETTVGASGVVGSVRGWEAELSSVAGPWFGPVSVRLGPVFRGDRVRRLANTDYLPDAFLIGFRGVVTADVDVVTVWAGVAPTWRVAGVRDPSPLTPGVTDLETTIGAAGRFDIRRVFHLQAGAASRVRLTAIGPVVDLTLVLHLSIGPS